MAFPRPVYEHMFAHDPARSCLGGRDTFCSVIVFACQQVKEWSCRRTDGPAIDEESVIRLRNAVLRVARRLRTSGDPEGLTATQSSVLATLVRQGPMRAGDLADAEALNPTLLSRVLGHLEARDLASRGPDPEDGRATIARRDARRAAPDRAPAGPAGGAAAGAGWRA